MGRQALRRSRHTTHELFSANLTGAGAVIRCTPPRARVAAADGRNDGQLFRRPSAAPVDPAKRCVRSTGSKQAPCTRADAHLRCGMAAWRLMATDMHKLSSAAHHIQVS